MYNYAENKSRIFTEECQVLFLAIRDKTQRLLSTDDAARLQEMIAGNSGDSLDMIACVDRMVELDEIQEIDRASCRAQDRVFVKHPKLSNP